MTRLLKLGLRGFHIKVAYVLNFYSGNIDGEIRVGPLDQGPQTRVRCLLTLIWYNSKRVRDKA